MKRKTALTISAILLAAALYIGTTTANPIASSMIEVTSPENNHIYHSNTVALTFSSALNLGFNFTSFSYSLDGQPEQSTDGNTVLTDLSSGSHTLKIYGNRSWQNESNYKMLLDIVYFNNIYSTALVNVIIGFVFFFGFSAVILFVNHRNLVARLKRQKRGSFWLGIICFIIAAIALVPSTWWYVDAYVFPHYPHGLNIPPFLPLIFGLILMPIALALIIYGTRLAGSKRTQIYGVVAKLFYIQALSSLLSLRDSRQDPPTTSKKSKYVNYP